MTRLLMLVFVTVAVLAVAQPQDDPAADMRRWLDGQREDFEQYVSEQDRAFAAFLGQAWQEFEVSAGRVRDAEPKPDIAPQAPPEPPPAVTPPTDTPPLPALPPRDTPPPRPAPAPADDVTTIRFLGLDWPLPAPRALGDLPRRPAGPEAAAEAWLALSAIDSAPLLATCDDLAEQRHLGDWGRFLLLEAIADEFYPADTSRRALLHWHLAVRTGLDVRLAHARPGFIVMWASDRAVFQIEFLVRDRTAYYLHDPDGRFARVDALSSYDGQPPASVAPLSFDFRELPQTGPAPVQRTLEWTAGGQPRRAVLTLDRELVAFQATIPQVGLESHFTAPVSAPVLAALADALRDDLAARDQAGRVALLLHVVQTALVYSTDQDQFGREDYLYPDEALFHPACDCEDRAALFAALVRDLLGMDVVGLDYPGHIAAAVALPGEPPGDNFRWRGEVFTVCDPTYIGAGPGRSMPLPTSGGPGVIDTRG
jgi:hypothetical protein